VNLFGMWAQWAIPVIASILILGTIGLSQTPLAYAVTTDCSGFLVAGTYDSIVVPIDSNCTILGGVTINGDVKISDGASLFGTEGGTVGGNVRTLPSTNCADVFIFGFTINGYAHIKGCEMAIIFNSVIGGDVEIKQSQDVAIIGGSTIGFGSGDDDDGIELEYNQGSTYQVFNNIVKDDIVVENNVINPSSPIPSFVGGNTSDELDCESNSPPPVLGSLPPNIASDKGGQCIGL